MRLTCDVNLLSSGGLFLDIAGVIMLFIYGLPSKISEGARMLLEEPGPAEIERIRNNEKIERRAKIGLVLLILGFIFQLLGSNFHLTI